jgi:hypothetical protein
MSRRVENRGHRTLAEGARARLAGLRRQGIDPAVVQQAKVDFFNALVDRNPAEAKRASAVLSAASPPGPALSPSARARMRPRTAALAKWVWALRERRDQEARGVVYPPPTPEQQAAGRDVAARFKRWLAGDDSAGPFE